MLPEVCWPLQILLMRFRAVHAFVLVHAACRCAHDWQRACFVRKSPLPLACFAPRPPCRPVDPACCSFRGVPSGFDLSKTNFPSNPTVRRSKFDSSAMVKP